MKRTTQLKKRGCCFICVVLGISHVSKLFRIQVNYENCDKIHPLVMCYSARVLTSFIPKELTGIKSIKQLNLFSTPHVPKLLFYKY